MTAIHTVGIALLYIFIASIMAQSLHRATDKEGYRHLHALWFLSGVFWPILVVGTAGWTVGLAFWLVFFKLPEYIVNKIFDFAEKQS